MTSEKVQDTVSDIDDIHTLNIEEEDRKQQREKRKKKREKEMKRGRRRVKIKSLLKV